MKKTFRIILISLCVILILVCGGIFVYDFLNGDPYDDLYEASLNDIEVDEKDKKDAVIDNETIKMSPDVDLAQERINHNNNDIIGRLEIPDLFNILVVRGTDNKYYLNRNLDKKSDIKGNEFLDFRVGPTSKQINIYGHNTRDPNIKVPFLRLERFNDEQFFNDNKYIILQYDGGKSVYKITAWKEVQDAEHMVVDTTGTDFLSHMTKLMTGFTFKREVPYDMDSDIIILQTCSHHLDNAYYLLIGIKIDYNGE